MTVLVFGKRGQKTCRSLSIVNLNMIIVMNYLEKNSFYFEFINADSGIEV